MEATVTYFRMNFEWFTNLVRDYWAEGEYQLAITVMTDSDIPLDLAHDIIRGKQRMIQDPNGKDGVDGEIVEDNWKPNLSRCWLGRYPDPNDLHHQRMVQQWGREGINYAKDICRLIRDSNNYLERLGLAREIQKYSDDLITWLGYDDVVELRVKRRMDIRSLGTNRQGEEVDDTVVSYKRTLVSNIPTVPGVPDLDIFVKRQLELDKAPKPKPDKTFSKPLGYILPNGKFYTCEWMEHNWLADVLEGKTKEQAKKAGWIEITHPINQPRNFQIIYGDKEPTQKQIDALFEWQKKYTGEIIKPAGEW